MPITRMTSFAAEAEVCGVTRQVAWSGGSGELTIAGLHSYTDMVEVLERLSTGAVVGWSKDALTKVARPRPAAESNGVVAVTMEPPASPEAVTRRVDEQASQPVRNDAVPTHVEPGKASAVREAQSSVAGSFEAKADVASDSSPADDRESLTVFARLTN